MRILITGSGGFLGKNIVNWLKTTSHIAFPIHTSDLNLTDVGLVKKYIIRNKINFIIHCAICGGKRSDNDSIHDFMNNILMFESLYKISCEHEIPIINFGSGAEFDRRYNINQCYEFEAMNRMPEDYYGLAKNLINRRILTSKYCYNFRLFGCFNYLENSTRFFKRNIQNAINGSPIIVNKDRYMDYVFCDDVIKIIQIYLENRYEIDSLPKSLNICYENKYRLLELAFMIKNITKSSSDILVESESLDNSYTGNCDLLYSLFDYKQFIGLERGIELTYANLINNN